MELMRHLHNVTHWHIESQQRSRRNAMLAATELADHRRQVLVVEEFLQDHARERLAGHG